MSYFDFSRQKFVVERSQSRDEGMKLLDSQSHFCLKRARKGYFDKMKKVL